MKQKQVELVCALNGRLSVAQRFVLQQLLNRFDEIEIALWKVNEEIGREVARCRDPFVGQAVELLQTIPGVGRPVAEVIVAEMAHFASDAHLSRWAGMFPGNNESSGKRKSGKTRKGSRSLRTALVQAAWAATHTKAPYLAAQYRRLAKGKERKKALVAVGHSMLVIVYHVLERKQSYQELGGAYFEKQQRESQCHRLVKQLESLGMKVTLEELTAAS